MPDPKGQFDLIPENDTHIHIRLDRTLAGKLADLIEDDALDGVTIDPELYKLGQSLSRWFWPSLWFGPKRRNAA